MAGWLALLEISQLHQQIGFHLPEGDFDTQGQEEGQSHGEMFSALRGGTFSQ